MTSLKMCWNVCDGRLTANWIEQVNTRSVDSASYEGTQFGDVRLKGEIADNLLTERTHLLWQTAPIFSQ